VSPVAGDILAFPIRHALRDESAATEKVNALRPELSWTHYRLHYERLLANREKAPVRKEAGAKLATVEPEQFIRDPYVLEFLDLKDCPALRESAVEHTQRLIEEDFHRLIFEAEGA
jgi:predicted nuclease of restriction endonuclease-like (RecB) superfamily